MIKSIEQQQKKSTLMVLFFVAVFIPFLDVIRVIKIETSPLAGLIASLILLGFAVKHKSYKVSTPAFLSLVFILYMFIRIRPDYMSNPAYLFFCLKTILSLFFGFTVFITAIKYGRYLKKKHVLFFVGLWCFVGIVQLSPLSGTMGLILEQLMTRNSFSAEGTRGLNMLANEPSYAGIYLILFLVLFDYFNAIGHKIKNKYYFLISFFSLLTFSSNALLLLLSYVFIKYIFSSLSLYKKLLSLIFSLFFIALLLNLETEARSLIMLQNLFYNPSILLLDESISSRFYYIVIAYSGLFESYLLGFGTASYPINWLDLAVGLNIINDVPQAVEIQKAFSESRLVMPMTFLGGVAHDFGIIGVLIFSYLIFSPVYLSRKAKLPINQINYITTSSLVIFSLWLQTCSYSLPLPWFLLGLNYFLIKNTGINQVSYIGNSNA